MLPTNSGRAGKCEARHRPAPDDDIRAPLWIIDGCTASFHPFGGTGHACARSISHAGFFFDDRKRVAFFSNYDGSLESYMDDFINKVGFGLNVSFLATASATPRTNWLVFDGCSDDAKFQGIPPAAPAADASLVPGLPGIDSHRPGKKPAHSARTGVAVG